jgi:hypothetical protein
MLFFELSGYYVNAVQLHVHAADVLVRCGVHREGFRYPPVCREEADPGALRSRPHRLK